MRNPVNRLATAAPRALESLFGGTRNVSKGTVAKDTSTDERPRSISFDLDLSLLDARKDVIGESSSVVTFEELADIMMEGDEKWSM